MKPRPSPTSPVAKLSPEKTEEVEHVWENTNILPPQRTPWGRLILLSVLLSAVSTAGMLIGLGLYVHRHPNDRIAQWLPTSTTSTTVVQQSTKDVTAIPTAVQAVQDRGFAMAVNQGKNGVYASGDTVGYAWALSSGGWLLSLNAALPAAATTPVLLPAVGDAIPVTTRVSDSATPYVFLKTPKLDAEPIAIQNAQATPGQRVWIVTPEAAFARQLARFVQPHWQSSDRSEGFWQLDAVPVDSQGAAVVDGEGRVIGLLGAEGRVWPALTIESLITAVIQNSRIARPVAGFTVADLANVTGTNLLSSKGWLVGASEGTAAVAVKGPAEKAGLLSGDRITTLDGTPVSGAPFLTLQSYAPGESVAVGIIRNGKEKTLTIKLGSSGS